MGDKLALLRGCRLLRGTKTVGKWRFRGLLLEELSSSQRYYKTGDLRDCYFQYDITVSPINCTVFLIQLEILTLVVKWQAIANITFSNLFCPE